MPRTASIQASIYADHAERLAKREANRLTDDDRSAIRDGIDGAIRSLRRVPSIAEDFNSLQRPALRSIGCDWRDVRQSELDEVCDMVAAAILDASLASSHR